MSIASRARQAARDLAAGRKKPNAAERQKAAYQHPAFSVTDFQKQAYEATLPVIPKEGEGKVRTKPVPRPGPVPAWQRDGYKSELHYEVAFKKTAMYQAYGDESHPLHKRALEAHAAGLLEGIK